MKKHLVATLLVAVMCLLTLSACSFVAGLENDVNITLNVNGNALDGNYVVNTFNNAIVPVPEAPKGDVFLGWTADKDWQNKDIADVALSQNKGLIRYDDVKDYAADGKITLYAVFGVQPRHDIAVAWYDKEKTSGLNQDVMDEFLTALKAFLTTQGYTPDSMDIVVRGYAGNVGPTCGAIMDDGDIDIMVGWAAASNIEGTGGMKRGVDFLQNYGNITLTGASKARYTAKLSDSEVVNKVYQWILSTYAGEGGATKDYDVADTPVVPDPDPTPTPDPEPTPDTSVDYGKKLTVSIWNNTKGGWITEEQIAKLKTDFEAYLTEKGLDVSTLSITWRVETDVTNVAALVAAVNAAGDVDFVLACGKNVNSSGNLTNLEKLQVAESPYMAANRYIAVLNKDNPRLLAKVLYKFISGQDYPEETLTLTDTTLTVSVWNNKEKWITEAQLDKLKADFSAYLAGRGVAADSFNITWKFEEATKVADLGAAVNADENVGFIVGCGPNVDTTGAVAITEKIKFASSGYMSADRYIAVVSKDKPNQLATLLWQFMYEQVFFASTQGGAE